MSLLLGSAEKGKPSAMKKVISDAELQSIYVRLSVLYSSPVAEEMLVDQLQNLSELIEAEQEKQDRRQENQAWRVVQEPDSSSCLRHLSRDEIILRVSIIASWTWIHRKLRVSKVAYHPPSERKLAHYIATLTYLTIEDQRLHFLLLPWMNMLRTYKQREVYQLLCWIVGLDQVADNQSRKKTQKRLAATVRQAKKTRLEELERCFPVFFPRPRIQGQRGKEKQVILRKPTAEERGLVDDICRLFAPGNCPASSDVDRLFADSLFSADPFGDTQAQQLFHAIICPECCGLAKLVYRFNNQEGHIMGLPDPQDMMGSPEFEDRPNEPSSGFPPSSGNSPPKPPAPLNAGQLQAIWNAWQHMQLRRQQFRAEQAEYWAIYINGREVAQVTPHEALARKFPVLMPSSFIQVYGRNVEGEVLLAASFVPDELCDLAPGTVSVQLVHDQGEVQITYDTIPSTVKTWWRGALGVVQNMLPIRRWLAWAWDLRPPRVNVALQPLIGNLARDLVTQLAPNEVPFFQTISVDFFTNPRRLLRESSSSKIVGAGVDGGNLYWTPVILAVTTEVLSRLREQVVTSDTLDSVPRAIEGLFTTYHSDALGESAILPLTQQQRRQVYEQAVSQARRFRFPEREARRLAEEVVRRLVVADS